VIDMSLVDKFLYKLFILSFILLSFSLLEHYSIISLTTVKQSLSENLNILTVVQKVNGNLNIIDLGDDIIEVGLVDQKVEEVNGIYLYKQKQKDVYSKVLGYVIRIENNNGLYNVLLQDENNNLLYYQELTLINVKMYQIVKINEKIGECNVYNDDKEYCYYYKLTIDED
jgi:hypothetical protein